MLRGDQSGTVVDRFFVCGAQMYGVPFAPGVVDTPAIVLLHARRTQAAWECLAELFKRKDYRASAQAALVVAAGYVFVHMTQSALLYIQKSYNFIKVGNVQFVPTYGRPPSSQRTSMKHWWLFCRPYIGRTTCSWRAVGQNPVRLPALRRSYRSVVSPPSSCSLS